MFQNKLKYLLFTIILTAFLGFASSCSKEEKCNGCYEDTPWSDKNGNSELCYPDEASCEAALGKDMCDKCDRKVKPQKAE